MFANHVQSTNVNLWLITPGQGLSNLGWHYIYNIYIYCPAFMIVEKVVLYICIFGHHGHSTNIHYWSELGTLRTLASGSELGPL